MTKRKFARAGTELMAWISGQFDTRGTEPMVAHLCQLADLMAALQSDIDKRTVILPDGARNPSIDALLKASAAFSRSWRILGLANVAPPAVTAPAKPGPRRVG